MEGMVVDEREGIVVDELIMRSNNNCWTSRWRRPALYHVKPWF
jgi:hypothetical protein